MKPPKSLLPITMLVVQAGAFAGGGAVQLREKTGPLVITVFTSPARLTAGPVDIGVLLQERNGLEPVLDADVSLLLREEASGAQIQVRATRDPARNNLLYAAPITLRVAGKWWVAVTAVERGTRTETAGVMDVAPTPAMVASYWGYVAFPPGIIMAFVVQGWLIRPKSRLSA